MLTRILNKIKRTKSTLSRELDILIYNTFTRKKQRKELPLKIKNAQTSIEHEKYNCTKLRSVERKPEDLSCRNLVVTCYFTLKPDPQTGTIRNASNFMYIQPWYESMMKIGASGIILHDGLDNEFIENYQNKQIQFRYCEMGNYSIFEERWLLYQLLLDQLPQLEKVFLTDSNDVFITRNPFDVVDHSQTLYVGRDNANRIKDSGWLKEECDQYIQESKHPIPRTYPYQWVYNAGVLGGSRDLVFFFTTEMSKLIYKATSNYHKDMTLLNIVIHEHFYPQLSSVNWSQKIVDTKNDSLASHQKLITGFPFNSGFKDLDLNSKALFIHK
jgi:hypothetical protein